MLPRLSHTAPTSTEGSRPPAPEDRGGHGSGGGFAVGPGDGHLGVTLHEASLHLAPAQDGATGSPRGHQFGVVFLHRGGVHYHPGAPQVLGAVPFADGHPQALKPPGNGALSRIGAADLVALAHEQLRQTAHADAADADEVVGSYLLAP